MADSNSTAKKDDALPVADDPASSATTPVAAVSRRNGGESPSPKSKVTVSKNVAEPLPQRSTRIRKKRKRDSSEDSGHFSNNNVNNHNNNNVDIKPTASCTTKDNEDKAIPAKTDKVKDLSKVVKAEKESDEDAAAVGSGSGTSSEPAAPAATRVRKKTKGVRRRRSKNTETDQESRQNVGLKKVYVNDEHSELRKKLLEVLPPASGVANRREDDCAGEEPIRW